MFVQKFDCKVMDWSSFGYVMFTKNRGRNWGIFDPNDFLKLFLKRMDFSIQLNQNIYTFSWPMVISFLKLDSLHPTLSPTTIYFTSNIGKSDIQIPLKREP